MFKTYFLIFFFCALFSNLFAQSKFSIEGIADYPDSTIIDYRAIGKNKPYRTFIKNKRFFINIEENEITSGVLGAVNFPGMLQIVVDDEIKLKIQNQKIYAATVENSKLTNELKLFRSQWFNKNIDLMISILKTQDTIIDSALRVIQTKKYDSLSNDNVLNGIKYLKNNSSSFISLKFLMDNIDYIKNTDTAYSLLSRLYRYKNHSYFKYLNNKIAALRLLRLPEKLVNKNYTTVDNKKINFSQITTKYILLNFWGTWCGPCLQEIPELKEIQDTYNHNVSIVSFANETVRKKIDLLIKFINEKKINWPNIYFTKISNGSIIDALSVSDYPTNILVETATMRIIYRGYGINSLEKIKTFLK